MMKTMLCFNLKNNDSFYPSRSEKVKNVCVSVTSKKCCNFWLVGQTGAKFSGPTYSSQVIFGQLTRTPRPSGSGPDPEKGGFCQIYLLRGCWGRGVASHLLGIGMTRQTKRWEQNFEFWPIARENGAWRPGWSGGNQNFGISTFFL